LQYGRGGKYPIAHTAIVALAEVAKMAIVFVLAASELNLTKILFF